MNVLVDTSVWIDHLHRPNVQLQGLLVAGRVWTHPVVIGELAAGRLTRRAEVLDHLLVLPRAAPIELREGLHLIETRRLFGRGLSWSDLQLIGAAAIDQLELWSRDRALVRVAAELGLGFADRV